MIQFEDMSLSHLKKIIKAFNLHNTINLSVIEKGEKPYRRPKTKQELINDIKKHLKIHDDNKIRIIKNSENIDDSFKIDIQEGIKKKKEKKKVSKKASPKKASPKKPVPKRKIIVPKRKEIDQDKLFKEIQEKIKIEPEKEPDLIKIGGLTKIMDIKTKDDDRLEKISKIIIDDMKEVNYKVYIVSTRKTSGHSKVQKALIKLIDDLKGMSTYVEWGRHRIDITNALNDTEDYDFVAFNFSKENGQVLLRSLALMIQEENYIYITLLSGSKYTYRIFEYLKNLMEKQSGISKEFNINWKKVKYLMLEAITTFNTLLFYSKQDMEIEEADNQRLNENIVKRFHLYSRHEESFNKLKDAILTRDEKGINSFMEEKEISNMPELFYFFKVKGADKAKKDLEEEIDDKIIPFNIVNDFSKSYLKFIKEKKEQKN